MQMSDSTGFMVSRVRKVWLCSTLGVCIYLDDMPTLSLSKWLTTDYFINVKSTVRNKSTNTRTYLTMLSCCHSHFKKYICIFIATMLLQILFAHYEKCFTHEGFINERIFLVMIDLYLLYTIACTPFSNMTPS